MDGSYQELQPLMCVITDTMSIDLAKEFASLVIGDVLMVDSHGTRFANEVRE